MKIIQDFINRRKTKLIEEKFLDTPIRATDKKNIKNRLKVDRVDILTIAFNNLDTIKLQSEYLKKNIKDTYRYIIGDNSSKEEVATQIENFCKKSKITYLRILGNPYNGRDPSKSHGIAINWAYKQLISKGNARYFGIIDHDIFPIKKTSIVDKLNKFKIYGHVQNRDNRWYLWPGFSFFDRQAFPGIIFNFLPISGLDTGGANWTSIYSHTNKAKLDIPSHYYIKYRDGDVVQNTSMEKIGDWLHLMNASGWKDGQEKTNIKNLIKKTINKDKQK